LKNHRAPLTALRLRFRDRQVEKKKNLIRSLKSASPTPLLKSLKYFALWLSPRVVMTAARDVFQLPIQSLECTADTL
jgi:hypothetical protein